MTASRKNGVQQAFLKFFSEEDGRWNRDQLKAAKAVMSCRTALLGGHSDTCTNCGYVEISYNSCRNRHCPLCGGLAKEKWIARKVADIVNAKHYHMVFTIPSELYPVAMANRKAFYDLMFEASSETVKKFCSDEKYLGAMPGITAILHTWGQQLVYHPHIHMVVTAGGFRDGRWKEKKKKKIFLPVKALSRHFRGMLVSRIRSAYEEGKIRFDSAQLSLILDKAMEKKWVVYSKEPFKDSAGVYEYLGRYTHRTAISNDRILRVGEKAVTFSYRDYADHNRTKQKTVEGKEFIRLFMLHVLPSGFMRVRNYGIYSSACKNTKLQDCQIQTLTIRPKTKINPEAPAAEIILYLTGRDIRRCPHCGALYPKGDFL